MQIREGLDWEQAVKELLQAADYLRDTGSPKVTNPAAGTCPCNTEGGGGGRGCGGGTNAYWDAHGVGGK